MLNQAPSSAAKSKRLLVSIRSNAEGGILIENVRDQNEDWQQPKKRLSEKWTANRKISKLKEVTLREAFSIVLGKTGINNRALP